MSAYVGICSSLCSRDALFADTFCGTRHLSWLCADKNGFWFVKQNNPCLFCGVGNGEGQTWVVERQEPLRVGFVERLLNGQSKHQTCALAGCSPK